MKILAALLEEEHERVKKPLPPPEKKPEEPLADGAVPDGVDESDPAPPPEDTVMADAEPQEVEAEEYDEPKEKGSEAVERRIEKIIADLVESGSVDVNDETELEQRRVSLAAFFIFMLSCWSSGCFCSGCDFTRLVHFIPSSSV